MRAATELGPVTMKEILTASTTMAGSMLTTLRPTIKHERSPSIERQIAWRVRGLRAQVLQSTSRLTLSEPPPNTPPSRAPRGAWVPPEATSRSHPVAKPWHQTAK